MIIALKNCIKSVSLDINGVKGVVESLQQVAKGHMK